MPTTVDGLVEIDLRDVKKLMAAALEEVRALDGLTPTEGNSASKASVKRSLLFTADLLDRASSEVRAQYHAINGNPDPLQED